MIDFPRDISKTQHLRGMHAQRTRARVSTTNTPLRMLIRHVYDSKWSPSQDVASRLLSIFCVEVILSSYEWEQNGRRSVGGSSGRPEDPTPPR